MRSKGGQSLMKYAHIVMIYFLKNIKNMIYLILLLIFCQTGFFDTTYIADYNHLADHGQMKSVSFIPSKRCVSSITYIEGFFH